MPAPDASPNVHLAPVLAVDCSSSVIPSDFRLQLQAIAAAPRNPAIYGAIAAGKEHRIALTLMLWSGGNSQAVAVPWRILASNADLETAAAEIAVAPRQWQVGGTAIAI